MFGSNPVLNEKTFAQREWGGVMADLAKAETGRALASTTMTRTGVVVKTSVLFVLCLATTAVNWILAGENSQAAALAGIGGAIIGAIAALVLCFKQNWAVALAPVYALAQGLFLGWLSQKLNARFDGIVITGVMITFGAFLGCVVAYGLGLIRLGRTAMAVVMMGTLAVGLAYLASWLLPMMGVTGIMAIHQGGTIGLVFSGVCIVLAIMSLIWAVQFVDEGVKGGAPKHMEWYAAFGLLSTLIWLYVEILRLLAKLRSNE